MVCLLFSLNNLLCFIHFIIKSEYLLMMPGLFANESEEINYLSVYLSVICRTYLILYILIHIK